MSLLKKTVCFSLAISSLLLNLNSNEISEKGYWIGDVPEWHATDKVFAFALVDFLKREHSVSIVDFGCGEGDYVGIFLDNGFESIGYDGNPVTPELTNGMCGVQDLSIPFHLGRNFDWVLSLEVGEHLPHQYETIFIENLMRHAEKGIILSWAVKGQGGTGHFNEQNNDYIKAIFAKYGYINDLEAETELRNGATLSWFKNSVMVFRKPS